MSTEPAAAQNPIRITDPMGLSATAGELAGFASEWWLKRQIERAPTRRIPIVGPALSIGDAIGAAAAVGIYLCSQDNGDDCAVLYAEITRARNELATRLQEFREDRYGLPMYGPMSRESHVSQFRGWQRRLQKLLKQADAKGCKAYEPDAWYLATVQIDRRF